MAPEGTHWENGVRITIVAVFNPDSSRAYDLWLYVFFRLFRVKFRGLDRSKQFGEMKNIPFAGTEFFNGKILIFSIGVVLKNEVSLYGRFRLKLYKISHFYLLLSRTLLLA